MLLEASTRSSDADVPRLVGESAPFRALQNSLDAVARAQRTTLITGPTGSGKDAVARTLHAYSARHKQPYVTVQCAALPDMLVEAEMFGHSRGAFTGATEPRQGLVRTAAGGTLFLDEIDSLSLSAQAKLLRFLETGEYRAVGSDRFERSDAWVIAATNQDLEERVRERQFRADLMFRLMVVKVDVPPLHNRREDILHLADYFLRALSEGRKQFAQEARAAMLSYDWPGNVRELKHRVEAAALLSESLTIDSAALKLGTRAPAHPTTSAVGAPGPGPNDHSGLQHELWSLIHRDGLSLAQAMRQCERALITAALDAEGNNRTRAAGRLGIHVRTIFKKIP